MAESESSNRYNSKFDEIGMIGFGSFGIVYKSFDKLTHESFAVKKAPINDKFKEKALKEINISKNLNTKFTVKLVSFWIDNNHYVGNHELIKEMDGNHNLFNKNNKLLLYIQMELCYKTLKEIILFLNKELNQKVSAVMSKKGYYISSEIFIEILECVDYLHKQNIIHRDLKPSNILITDGTGGRFVKVADFGLATTHNYEQTHTKYTGSPKFVAPEVLRSGKYDTKADIYSLSVMAQDLFVIDINEPVGKNSNLKDNYLHLFKLVKRMLHYQTNKRPNCEQILKKKDLWALSLDQLNLSVHLKMNDGSKTIEESFHKFFIQTKYRMQIGSKIIAHTTDFVIKKIILKRVEEGFSGFYYCHAGDFGPYFIRKIEKGNQKYVDIQFMNLILVTDSPAHETDLEVGDIIFEVNKKCAFCSKEDLVTILGKKEADIQIEMVVIKFKPNERIEGILSRSQIGSILTFINDRILDCVENTKFFSGENMQFARKYIFIAKISERVQLVQCLSNNKIVWHYMLVDEHEMKEVLDGSGIMDAKICGYILKRGCGEDVPPFDEILDIALQHVFENSIPDSISNYEDDLNEAVDSLTLKVKYNKFIERIIHDFHQKQ